jgi:dihydroorotate dehydrogenase
VLYPLLFKLVFSRMDPERAHHLGMTVIRFLGALKLARLARLGTRNQPTVAMGLEFDGPFGLAAGFDKNAIAIRALGDLGFSHVEIGTVTRFAQPGNERPRLFRLIKDSALINRMGFNNQGADVIADRLTKLRSAAGKLPIIGVNIGKSRVTEVADAVSDYQYSSKQLAPVADYLAVNVSSPNTPGLRDLQAIDQLEPILLAVKQQSLGKPVVVKIAPDLADEDIKAIAKLVEKLELAGVIASNTSVARSGLLSSPEEIERIGSGGLSGPILAQRAIEVLGILREVLDERFAVISVGGVQSASDVQKRLQAGANLVQGYTGFIYQGPLWARKIRAGLTA